MSQEKSSRSWTWIPTLYFAEGLPYVTVMTLAVTLYKNLGLSNSEIAFYTSWMYFPWVIKPIWSPFIDIIKTKRAWIVAMQSLCGAAFAGIALTLPSPFWLQASLAFFWILAFSSATHDIAADGFYMLALSENEQTLFVGIRNTFYRLANIFGQGILVMLAGGLAEGKILSYSTGNFPLAWSLVFFLLAAIFIGIALYHFLLLPHPSKDARQPKLKTKELFYEFFETIRSFFAKKHVGLMIGFILCYRLGESQLIKIASPFFLDPIEKGGLGLETSEVGLAYGTIGVMALLAGGILGGLLASRFGFRKCLVPMAFTLNIPHLLYLYLAWAQPESFGIILAAITIEQFGYGVGFAAFMLYLIYISQGKHQTAHYSIATGLMALGMMLPGMLAGWLQEILGYTEFFAWICLCALPSIFITYLIKKHITADFGKKNKNS